MSYVLGGLFRNESLEIIKTYSKYKDWNKTRETILVENRLNSNMKRTSKRIYHEIELRLKTLTGEQVELLESGTAEEQRQILWLACCKSYALLFEMATELISEKRLIGEKTFTLTEYKAFYSKKALNSEKLQNLKESTQKKLKSVTFKILRDAEIIDRNYNILPQLLSRQVKKVIELDNPQLLKIYP
jgi:hypothetical protein